MDFTDETIEQFGATLLTCATKGNDTVVGLASQWVDATRDEKIDIMKGLYDKFLCLAQDITDRISSCYDHLGIQQDEDISTITTYR